jgi:hypothetical protein
MLLDPVYDRSRTHMRTPCQWRVQYVHIYVYIYICIGIYTYRYDNPTCTYVYYIYLYLYRHIVKNMPMLIKQTHAHTYIYIHIYIMYTIDQYIDHIPIYIASCYLRHVFIWSSHGFPLIGAFSCGQSGSVARLPGSGGSTGELWSNKS